MALIILQSKAITKRETLDDEFKRFRKMINEGLLLLDSKYSVSIFSDENVKFFEGERSEEGENPLFLEQQNVISKVERTLGFELFKWQKEFILEGIPYGTEIKFARRAGKTLAHILRLCLSDGEPIKATLSPACLAKNEFLSYLGEDGSTVRRSELFIYDLKGVYEKLKAAGDIPLRKIQFQEVSR